MNIYRKKTKKCPVCGHTHQFDKLAKTMIDGPTDLDTRPSGEYRIALYTEVQRCPECGMCAPDYDIPTRVRDTVYSEPYKNQLVDQENDKLTNSFLCSAKTCVSFGNYCLAGWSYIYAAWTFDDAERTDKAIIARLKAIKMIEHAHISGQRLIRNEHADLIILVDLYRRTNQFKKANTLALKSYFLVQDPLLKKIFGKQFQLSEANDNSVHQCPFLAD